MYAHHYHVHIPVHVYIHIHVHSVHSRVGMKVEKQHSKLRQQKQTNIRRFARVFNNFLINVALTLIGYRTPSNWIIAL